METQRERYAHSQQPIGPQYAPRFFNRTLRVGKMLEQFAKQNCSDRLVCEGERTRILETINSEPFSNIAANVVTTWKIAAQVTELLISRQIERADLHHRAWR